MHLIEIFDRGALINPDRIAFTDPAGETTLTYAEAEALTHRIAAALRREGLGEGSPVGVLSSNTVYAFPYVLGAVRAGCAWVGINARSTASELSDFLRRIEAQALIVDPGLRALADEVSKAVPTLRRLLPVEPPDTPDGWLEPPGSTVPLPRLDPEATSCLFSTGGTTGAAKAVKIPHRALAAMTLAMTSHMPEESPVHLVAAPLTHAAGALVFPVLLSGGTNIVHPGVDPDAILRSIQQHRATRLFLPPTALYALLEHPSVGEVDTSSLRYFIYGAAPMAVARLRQAIDVFGPVLAQFYGQVELPMMCTFLSPEEHRRAVEEPGLAHRLASCGRASMVANVAVMDDEGTLLPPGTEGEIVVRSALQMTGYAGAEESTRSARRPGGWQATGDLGVIDEHGYVYLRDRKRDLIISGGYNVFPTEVEQVLWEHPAVLDCAVIGTPDEKWGERVSAVVELRPGAEATEDELIAWCRTRLSGVKTPKSVIVDRLPRSSVGKVLKRQLRDRYWQGRDRKV